MDDVTRSSERDIAWAIRSESDVTRFPTAQDVDLQDITRVFGNAQVVQIFVVMCFLGRILYPACTRGCTRTKAGVRFRFFIVSEPW